MTSLVVLKAVSDDTQGKGLNVGDGLILGRTVGQYARELDHLGDPTPVGLVLQFDCEDNRHLDTPRELHSKNTTLQYARARLR